MKKIILSIIFLTSFTQLANASKCDPIYKRIQIIKAVDTCLISNQLGTLQLQLDSPLISAVQDYLPFVQSFEPCIERNLAAKQILLNDSSEFLAYVQQDAFANGADHENYTVSTYISDLDNQSSCFK